MPMIKKYRLLCLDTIHDKFISTDMGILYIVYFPLLISTVLCF